MQKILLLDYDYTLYPSTLSTLKAVDLRINLYIQTFLGASQSEADSMRIRFWDVYGTTLKGLEENHGVDREHYCDFIHDIETHFYPPPNLELTAWLNRLPHPTYIFTNARKDWAIKGFHSMGLGNLLPKGESDLNQGGTSSPQLQGIFDIAFMDWIGKPHEASYTKVESFLKQKHGENIQIHFADDRRDNLETARNRNWVTHWVTPHDAPILPKGTFHSMINSLTALDPESLM